MQKKIILKIYGRVQGVFFRDSTKKEAKEFGIFGFARNEPDGTVYIEAEGEEKNLGKFIAWCQNGPEHSKVEKVNIEYKNSIGEFSSFEIK